ncbi:MAG TPA: hypothetical protein VKZ53_08830 [Candidatus Angelobacter sp.]|nr:hypothetical protein [Candidatus Angelobacter sp.]
MINCRSISPEMWAHVRESLIFYFSRRHLRADAEDLAQETLITVWNREDYQFEREEDFPKVCFGFARNILQESYRETSRLPGEALDSAWPAPSHDPGGTRATEARILLRKVFEIGKSQLRQTDWEIIQKAVDLDQRGMAKELGKGDSNKGRVRLFRARSRLGKLTGLDET